MTSNAVFVFGSNLAGRHGKGAALFALQHRGAIRGIGVGRQGRAYAIPTKDHQLRTLPLESIRVHVREFLAYAAAHPAEQFQVTRIGCGLAGYQDEQIAPMFEGSPANCMLPAGWASDAERVADPAIAPTGLPVVAPNNT